MTTFTQTTNYSFKKPIVGSATDQWGTHLNETIDGVDSQLKTLADSITSQQLEELGNVVNVTPVDDQFLRYNGTNWTAETVTIPDVLNDLSNVSGTPSSGDVLTYNGSAWAPASVTSAAVADGSVTNAKLHPSLQTVIGRILVTDDDDSPTDNQILVYSTTDSEWKYADQAGSTLQTLTDVNSTGLSDGDLMKYDGTAGEFVFIDAAAARTLLNVDVSGTDNSIPTTLDTTSHDYLTLSSQQITLNPIVLTDDVSGTLPIANGGTSASTASGARTALGLGGLATQDTITESQISDLQSYITASSTDTLTNKSGNISQWTNDSGYLTAETNDLSNVSGTLAIANGGTGSSSAATARVALLPALATNGSKLVSVNSGATDIEYIATSTLSITESQISDLQSYLTAEVNDLSAAVTWTNVPDANITQSSVTQHQAALSITESQISDLQTYLTAETNDLSAAVIWTNVPDANITQSSVTQHQAALSITESQISDLQSYLTASSTDTLTNKSGNISQWTNDAGYLTAETNDLTNVSGTLAIANGGTGSTTASGARTALGVDPAGTDNSTDVTLANVTGNYLSLSGQQITAGTVPVTLGGTGSTTASDARTALGVDPAGTDNSTDITLATVTDNYLTLSGQEITAGTVPVSLGGTGSTTASDARTALGVDPAGTDNSTNVTLVTTSHDYLSLSSQAITLGPIVLTTDVSGTLPVASGGTGVTALSSLNAADLGSNNGVTDATDGYVLTADGIGGVAWEAAIGGVSDIVSDTTPQLGGNLDVNGQSIVSVSAGNIAITPDTTGKIILDGLSWPTADGSANQVLKTDGAGNLSFVNQSGGGSGSSYIEHSSTVSDSLAISSGTNRMYIGNSTFSGSGTMGGYLVISHGYANFTGTVNVDTGTLNVVS